MKFEAFGSQVIVQCYRPTEVVEVGTLLGFECLLEVCQSTVGGKNLPEFVVTVSCLWVGWRAWQNQSAVVGELWADWRSWQHHWAVVGTG